MRYFILLLLCFCIRIATAQTLSELQQNEDVTWIGELYVDYSLEIDWYQDNGQELLAKRGIKEKNKTKWIKFLAQNPNSNLDEQELLWSYHFLKRLESLKKYKTASLSQEISPEEYKLTTISIDTIWNFDDFSSSTALVYNELYSDQIKAIRLKELIYYHQKDRTFRILPLALAPLIQCHNSDSLEIQFWLEVETTTKQFDFNSALITWAKRTYRDVPLDNINVLKGEKNIGQLMDGFITDILSDSSNKTIYEIDVADGSALLSTNEVYHKLVQVDTIYSFEPDNWDEPFPPAPILFDTIQGKDLKAIRFAQDWVWDVNKKLQIRFVQFSPIIYRYDDNDNFLNSGPLFHKREKLLEDN